MRIVRDIQHHQRASGQHLKAAVKRHLYQAIRLPTLIRPGTSVEIR